MKDITSCFSNHALRVADVACSGRSTVINRYSFAGPKSQSNGCTVTSTYISRLTSQKEILIHLTWSNDKGRILTIHVDDQFYNNSRNKASYHAISIQFSHEKKGNRTFTWGSYTVKLYWEFTLAVYSTGPEPISGFHVAMSANSEFVLLQGDVTNGYLDLLDLNGTAPTAQTRLISRKDRVHGLTSYTTKARFHPADKDHEIGIKYEEDKQVFSVNVDEKLAVHVTKLKWNFRGSQTIFFEKMVLDIMWNLHGWLYGDDGAQTTRCASFMFRARSSLGEWLWQVEDGTIRRSSLFTIEAFNFKD